MVESLTIRRPDDWHLHFRDGETMRAVVPQTARQFARAIVMPNLAPPVTTTALAAAYRDRIGAAVPEGVAFTPLMTAYLTDESDADDLAVGHADGVLTAAKLYPAGATTNSAHGVTDVANIMSVLERMAEIGMPLCVHGEVTTPDIDIFDREAVFIDRILQPLVDRLPTLRVIFEHITTMQAVSFVESAGPNVAATITPQHLHINRNDILVGGIRPHMYCLPVAKREQHRLALRGAATSGSSKYFLGTDSAPHHRHAKESDCGCAGIFNAPFALESYVQVFEDEDALDRFEAFASLNGPAFYGLAPNEERITLEKAPVEVPQEVDGGEARIVPFHAGETLSWRLAF
ncbi:dihydroorotase [Qipengyuania flava]|jgi:dihydroorotase|uniref:dihydroorotase n=1 Tax=Qipengyuania flava TaxID=192812 RepID=UPI001C57FE52|nr:dihydroorotase [Qipengyuania flava]MBW3167835.1 dihydroorotase [Qipengyuania flava]MBY5965073.1 dihydroorotase [Qipengyuania flava]MBY6011397.1 dihydroorotase [Qipengyuania flava]MBY6025839.1 dihydroorotase [Qipengyuania flava]|tara:strand:- start:292 stop:1329 length:1038 start_codon:yes stop_codon:yes gene_type:complete